MSRLQERWAQRRADRMPVAPCEERAAHGHRWRLFKTAELLHPVDEVWDLVLPAEHGPLLDPERVARGYDVPGTPEGVGQQHCFVTHEGDEIVAEVIEYVAGHRAVVHQVSPLPDLPVRWVHELEVLGEGCALTYAVEVDLPPGRSMRPEVVETLRSALSDYLENVRLTLGPDDGDCRPLPVTPG